MFLRATRWDDKKMVRIRRYCKICKGDGLRVRAECRVTLSALMDAHLCLDCALEFLHLVVRKEVVSKKCIKCGDRTYITNMMNDTWCKWCWVNERGDES